MELQVAQPGKTTQSSSPIRRWLYLLTGLLIGGVFLYLTARNVDLHEVMGAIYAIKSWWLLPLTLIYILNVALRGVRWRLMFPDESRPSLRHAVDAFLIGKVGNNFMPGRIGELLRAGVVGRLLPKVGLSGSLATIVVEKMFDAFAILILLGVALLSAPLPLWVNNAGISMIVTFPALLLALWVMDRAGARSMYSSGTDSTAGVINRAKGLVFAIFQKFSTGLYALRTVQHFALLSAITLLIWFGEVIVMLICLQAFSISVPFMAAVVSLVFLCVGSMLPAAPGFIGTYQLFIVAALQLYQVSETNAFALSVFLNLYVIVMTSILGVVAVLIDGGLVNFRQVFASASKKA